MLAKSSEYQAYVAAKDRGDLQDLPPGTCVAFLSQGMIGIAPNIDDLLAIDEVDAADGNVFITKVNAATQPMVFLMGPQSNLED